MKRKSTPGSSLHAPSPELLLAFYARMYLLRHFELTVQQLYKSGELPGFIHLYVGEEATGVGVCSALREDDWIASTHRGHGHALAKGVPPKLVLAELFGKSTGCSGGRGGTMHLHAPQHGLLGTNGIVGGSIPLAVGLGMSAMIRKSGQAAVSFFGDGASNHGYFLESVNFATVQKMPVVFVCENNLYATCIAYDGMTGNTNFLEKARGYGLPGVSVDGNDVVAVWQAATAALRRAREGKGPTLIEARTYRWVGHHEGDPPIGTYRSEEEVDRWKELCPLKRHREYLLHNKVCTKKEISAVEKKVKGDIEEAVAFGRSSPAPDPATVHLHVLADPVNPPIPPLPAAPKAEVQNWLTAVRDGIAEEMRRDPTIVYLGEGIGERGGTFGHTKDLWQEFGPQRVVDTPICELAFTGASIGASATGCRVIADLMMADFLFEAASQIVHQASKLRYVSNNQISAPVIIRSGMGAIKSAGAHHSGTYYPMWAHCPGLLIAVPSTPADAKGLFKTALRASDPVLFMDHKALLSIKGPVPKGDHLVPFGSAAVVREGKDVSIVSCGAALHLCIAAADKLRASGVSCEVIDLRTIVPLDVDTIVSSLSKTGKLLVVDEAFSMCGIGGEIAAIAMEHAFDELDAPVGRLHTAPVAIPFSPGLEAAALLSVDKIAQAVHAVMQGCSLPQSRPQGAGRSVRQEPPFTFTPTVTEEAPAAAVAPAAAAPAQQPASVPTDGEGTPVIMPNMDLTIAEATVVKWHKKIGDAVKKDEVILEVETDKAVVEIESPAHGVLSAIFAPEEAVVPLGGQLGMIQSA